MSERMVERFTTGERLFHWVYFLTFAVLAVTGFVLFFPWTPFTMGEAGETNRMFHRLIGIVFIVVPAVTWIFSRRGLRRDMAAGFHFDPEDRKSIPIFIKRTYWTGDTTGLPPQGKFMAGQKLNIVVQTLMFFVLVATGLVMWLARGLVPQWLMQTTIILHAVAAIVVLCFVIIHVYMVTTMPFSRGATDAMITGKMTADLAASHHARWKP